MRGVRARVRLYAAGRSVQHTCRSARARATKNSTPSKQAGKRDTADTSSESSTESAGFGELGPIGLTVGGAGQSLQDRAGASLGPISLSFADSVDAEGELTDDDLNALVAEEKAKIKSINTMTTSEWREKYEKDGAVDLWVEEEFNSGSRVIGGGAVARGGEFGQGSGEGKTLGVAAVHHVTIHDRRHDQVVEVDIPEDRYILWEAEDEGLELPYACRMGCCTACAVRVKEGSVWQPEALGISMGLKEQGYALMCVGYPEADTVLETVEEDELYQMQFGESFAEMATDKNSIFIERDDFALELAEMDE